MTRKSTIDSLFEEVRAAEQVFHRRCARLVAALPVDSPETWRHTVDHALKAGLSQRELARECGCSTSTISRWADGSNAPSLAARKWTKERFCRMLGVEPVSVPTAEDEVLVVTAAE